MTPPRAQIHEPHACTSAQRRAVAHDDVHESARDVVHWLSAVADAAADKLAASMQPASVDINRRTHEDESCHRRRRLRRPYAAMYLDKPLRGEAKPRAADQPRELDAGAGEFAGNYRTQFLNTGLSIPMSLAMVPISAYGGGVISCRGRA
jgi:hypothetical protein